MRSAIDLLLETYYIKLLHYNFFIAFIFILIGNVAEINTYQDILSSALSYPENLGRLKKLEYLNLTLNNIEVIENLEGEFCLNQCLSDVIII